MLALAGQINRAEKLAEEINTDFPLDTLVQGYWLPEIRATVHLRRSEPDQALEALRETSAYELSMNGGLSVVYLARLGLS